MNKYTRRLVLALTLALVIAPAAAAQNALGDGTALDNNLNVEGTRNLPQAGSNFGLRNLLVTRNVAAGRGFRDAVGYRAADDFRGATGSDDLFGFRADSAMSALDVVNIGRGWQSISIGQDIGVMAYRRDTVGSTLPSVSQGTPVVSPGQYGQIMEAEARLDRALLDYQSNGRLLMTESRPESLAYFTTPDGAVVQLTASALRGLRMGPAEQDPAQIGLTQFDRARLLDQALAEGELTAAPGTAFELDVRRLLDSQPGMPPPGAGVEAPATSLMRTVPTSYQEMLDALAAPPAGSTAEEAATRLNEQMLRTTHWLRSGEQLEPTETTPEQAAPALNLPGVTQTTLPDFSIPAPPAAGETNQVPAEAHPHGGMQVEGSDTHDPVKLPPNMSLEMLRHRRVIDTLAAEGDDRFTEVMRAGEERLRAGEFFLAERQFVRANSFHPGHPMALAGLANAQLGAGILASASVSLRNLFVNRPEMIDVQYGPGLRPSDERLAEMVIALERRLGSDRRTSGAALVLAYIGRQTGDRAMMQRGIDMLTEIDRDDPLIPVLQTIWLEGAPLASQEK